jgi:hypothetical protein
MHCSHNLSDQKCQLLEPHERYVTMLLDEIYVEPKVSYKGGTVKVFAVTVI